MTKNKQPKPPNFLIVGAMKSGTTTLAHSLNLHPEVFVCPKEINYFFDFSKDVSWYKNHFKTKKTIIGEKAPIYMYLPAVAKKIQQYNPKMKLIFILRNPVDRTYSNYWHAYKQGRETFTFEKALAEEKERIMKDIFYGYVQRSKYALQIQNYLKYFSINQMHFIIYEEFIDNPHNTIKETLRFLGVDDSFSNKIPQKNISRTPRSITFQRFIYRNLHKYPIYKPLYYLNKYFGKKSYPKMSKITRDYLQNYFAPYNKKLEALLNRKIKVWQVSD